MAGLSCRDADPASCKLVGCELRGLPCWQVQHWDWVLDICRLCLVCGWDILDWNRHGNVSFLHFLPIGNILDWEWHDQQLCLSELLRLPDRPVQRVQLQ